MNPLPASAGVFGWPVAHSRSPLIHRFWLQRLGLDGDYGRFPVHPDKLAAALRALPAFGLRGVNVTVPHKQAVMPLLDRLDPLAAAIGAVNTVVVGDDCLTGYNTDAIGFAEALPDLGGQTAIVVGAGGAARAVLTALAARGVARFTLVNRDVGKAQRLLAEFGLDGGAAAFDAEGPSADVLVNASTLGMDGHPPLPDLLARIAEHGLVYDIVYSPLDTALLRTARGRGLRTIDGLSMLIGQARAAFFLFYGAHAPADAGSDAELRALLTR